MFYTYILKSLKDCHRYIGSAEDVHKRLSDHNQGFVKATFYRRPLELLCYKEFKTRIEAVQYERYLKSLKGGNQLKKEIDKMLDNNKS
jgi:putative endonuclease